MVKTSIDRDNNILILSFEGTVDQEQLQDLYRVIKNILPNFYGGFKIITDLSLLDNMYLDAHFALEEIMDLCNDHGVSKIIRVIPDPSKDIGFNLMSIFHYSKDVHMHSCQTFKEAKKYFLWFKRIDKYWDCII